MKTLVAILLSLNAFENAILAFTLKAMPFMQFGAYTIAILSGIAAMYKVYYDTQNKTTKDEKSN